MRMPTYERRFFLNTLREQNEKRKEAEEEAVEQMKTGKNTRTTKIGGDALKTKIKNGEMPDM
jgi:hypothetical protein